MIDNFAPQPFPLEASSDGNMWLLVIGWHDLLKLRRQEGAP